LLQTVVKMASWKDGILQRCLFEPFEILRHSNWESSRKEKENDGSGRDSGVWLPKTNPNPKCQMENFSQEGFSGEGRFRSSVVKGPLH
jgi:hypothetical protein